MFKSITKSKANLSVSTTDNEQNSGSCLIAKGTTIEGKFNSVDDVRVEGIIKGEVYCEKRLGLEVEEGAQYEGTCKVGDRFAKAKGEEMEVAMVA